MSYANVVVAVEPNAEASAIVRQAKAISGDAPLTLVSALPEPAHHYGADWTHDATGLQVAMLEDARRRANEAIEQLATDEGIPSDRVFVRSGKAASVVQAVACEVQADCIIVGSHGQHGLSLFFGSTANALIHGLKCDAYFVRMGTDRVDSPSRVICAIDQSDETDPVVDAASQLAEQHGASLCLVSVVKPIANVYGGLDLALLSHDARSFEQDAEDRTNAWLKNVAEHHGIADKASTHVAIGNPATEIREFADGGTKDVIVMGSHGRSGLGRLLGSTANGVLHGSSSDVLVVRIGVSE